MKDCIHFRAGHGVRKQVGKPDLHIHRCDKLDKACIELADERMPAEFPVCAGCLLRETAERPKCFHRGESLGLESAELCGLRGKMVELFVCNLNPESPRQCALTRYCERQTAVSCASCDDYSSIPMLPPQEYSSKMPCRSDPETPIPVDVSNFQRHLIYHIWPKSGNDVWKWNVAQLLKRIELFNGVRTIGVALSDDADSLEDVKAAFAGVRIDNWVVRPNDRARGEGGTFTAMLRTLPLDGVTFYAHAKGVKWDGRQSIKMWVELMYRATVDDWERTETALAQFPIVGSLKDNFHVERLEKSHHWHFAGTFFWFRNRDVFSRPEWKSSERGYYETELWPSRLFTSGQSKSLFGEMEQRRYDDLYDLDFEQRLADEFEAEFPTPTRTLSVIIASLGRSSLPGVIRELKRQLTEDDEIIVVCDGQAARERCEPAIEGVQYLVHADPYSRVGNAQKRFGQQAATKDLLWFVDDDDEPHAGAVRTIKSTVEGRPVIFKMRHQDRMLWQEKEIRDGNVGSPMLVVPRAIAPLFPGGPSYNADMRWVELVAERSEIDWSDRCIYAVKVVRNGAL